MTQEQLLKQFCYCKSRWNGWGEDVFQEACLIALERYKSLENVNQKLFRLLCLEAARNLRRHEKYEICFSQLQYQQENEDDQLDFENTIVDPRVPCFEIQVTSFLTI
jgi:DNA-directed RNA polymerase specialized sigma24 family protein